MRKIILMLAVILTLGSCSKTYYLEKANVFDFRKYTEQGFVVNPTSNGGKFTPIAIVDINFYSGYILPDEYKDKKGITKVIDKVSKSFVAYETTPERMLERIIEECKKLGANGIVEFNIKYVNDKSSKGYWKATGIAVKL